jgi:outer membrane biosynthesis protein TonB
VKKLSNEDKVGIYLTVIVHLTVMIILLITQIGFSLAKENTFVLDFSRQDDLEEQKKQEDLKRDIVKKVDKMIDESPDYGTPVRNVAVNRNALKDDRKTNAEQLYKDAARLEKELKAGVQDDEEEDMRNEAVDLDNQKKQQASPAKAYSGPSVISYFLDGRKASHLSIPAYRCLGGGEVTVIIGVDNAGNVIYAKVQDENSSNDGCLRNFAVRAARGSKFSASPKAPPKQMGNIIYKFIAQ